MVLGSAANLENRLSQRSEAHCETALSREHVKAALFEIGWRGHKLLGQMFELGMSEIRTGIPDPNESKVQIHNHLYNRQQYLASLPLAMILNYRRFALEGFLGKIWAGTVDEHDIDALHSMLYFYSEMATWRRAADRRAKMVQIRRFQEISDSFEFLLLDRRSTLDRIVEAMPDEEIPNCLVCDSLLLDRDFRVTPKTTVMNCVCQACGTKQPEKRYPTAKVREWMMVDHD